MVPELATERLFLQQILPADQDFIFEGLSHPAVIPFYGVRYSSYEATSEQMDWYHRMAIEGTGLSWKMVAKNTSERLGVISVYYFKPEHKKAEVGFWLLPSFWRKGYAIEALQRVMDYWRKEKGLHRLESFVEEGNIASSRLLEKAGFVYEGTLRDCEVKEGRYISLQVFACLFE